MKTYWTPPNKTELLKWFKRNRTGWKQSHLKVMPKKQLYAVFYKTRNKGA